MNELGCFVVPFLFISAAFALVALIIAVQARNRIDELQRTLQHALAQLPATPSGAAPDPAAAPPPTPEAAPWPAAPVQEPTAPAPEEPVSAAEPRVDGIPPLPASALDMQPQAAFAAAEPAPGTSRTADSPVQRFEEPPLPPETPLPPAPPARTFDWESLVGVKLFSWIAAIALALAGVLFLRYSIERGWLSPPVQMFIGLAAGAALILLGELRFSRRYAVTANAMDGAGLAIIYATLFAAHNIWRLLPAFGAFLAIVSVTALAVWLAIRRDSAFIALLGLLGGFAAPALLSAGRDRPIALFGYLLAVNVGAAWVAYKRNWPALTALSLVFTTIYQWHWVTRFLDASRLPLAAAIFLIFPIAGILALTVAAKRGRPGKSFERTSELASALPLVFGLYAAAVPAYGQNYRILFSFLFITAAGLAALAIGRRHESLHLLGAGSTVLAFLVWFSSSYSPAAFPHILAIALCFQMLYLAVPMLARRFMPSGDDQAGQGFSGAALGAVYAAPLLMFILPTLAVIEPQTASGTWLGGATVVMLAMIGIWTARSGNGGLFAVAFGFAFVAEVFWAVDYLRPIRSSAAIVFFTSVSMVCFLVALLRRRWNNVSPPLTLAEYFALVGFLWLAFIAGETGLNLPEWRFVIAGALLLSLAAVTARYTMRTAPFAIAVGLSNLALLGFESQMQMGAWPSRSVIYSAAIAAFCGIWMIVSSRREPRETPAAEQPAAPGTPRFAPWHVPFALSLFFGMVVAIIATDVDSPPAFALMLGAQLFFTLLLILLARTTELHGLAAGAAFAAGLGMFAWREGSEANHPLWQQLVFGVLMYVPFIAYTGTLRERIRSFLAPYLAAVIASVFALLYFWTSLDRTWVDAVMGALPLLIASILALLLRQLLRLDPGGSARPGRLALMAAAVLAFVTASVPMQLDREWLTVAWALEAAALAWLATRLSHRGLIHWSTGLGFAVFVRLVLNPAVFDYHTRDVFPIFNWYLYTYAVSAAALFVGAYYMRRLEDRIIPLPRTSTLFSVGATIILFLLLNIEIADFYSTGSHLTFNFSGTLAQDLTYTLGWAVFAIGMLIVGIYLTNRPVRVASIALLAVAVVKCFLHDLARLGGLYRVGSLVGLAICLGLVAVLLQKFVFTPRVQPSQEVS